MTMFISIIPQTIVVRILAVPPIARGPRKIAISQPHERRRRHDLHVPDDDHRIVNSMRFATTATLVVVAPLVRQIAYPQPFHHRRKVPRRNLHRPPSLDELLGNELHPRLLVARVIIAGERHHVPPRPYHVPRRPSHPPFLVLRFPIANITAAPANSSGCHHPPPSSSSASTPDEGEVHLAISPLRAREALVDDVVLYREHSPGIVIVDATEADRTRIDVVRCQCH
mmetsp:Transcript_27402/g.65883  ORF Transcript_27402/g.65883 Transcript_27402/m.65883 type:complete len:226 (+) Transcript_27402:131-808(+)